MFDQVEILNLPDPVEARKEILLEASKITEGLSRQIKSPKLTPEGLVTLAETLESIASTLRIMQSYWLKTAAQTPDVDSLV